MRVFNFNFKIHGALVAALAVAALVGLGFLIHWSISGPETKRLLQTPVSDMTFGNVLWLIVLIALLFRK